MEQKEVVELMKSSKSSNEWNENCNVVKARCSGYPQFWYGTIVLSGLLDKTRKKYNW